MNIQDIFFGFLLFYIGKLSESSLSNYDKVADNLLRNMKLFKSFSDSNAHINYQNRLDHIERLFLVNMILLSVGSILIYSVIYFILYHVFTYINPLLLPEILKLWDLDKFSKQVMFILPLLLLNDGIRYMILTFKAERIDKVIAIFLITSAFFMGILLYILNFKIY